MRGFCVVCGCGIDGHQDTTWTDDGKAHLSCTEDPPNPPVGRL